MAKLYDMLDRVTAETKRYDLRQAAAQEAYSAIRFYSGRRFWFNERRSRVAFDTVSGQSDYTGAAHADIPNLISIDFVSLAHGGRSRHLSPVAPKEMDRMIDLGAAPESVPAKYAYYGQELRVYPVPNAAYPVKIAGVTRWPAPANAYEDGNPWMNEAEELIRFRVESKLWANWMGDSETGEVLAAQEQATLDDLLEETSRRMQVSRLRSTAA